jgi:4'-phosphopantetheinyl transferase
MPAPPAHQRPPPSARLGPARPARLGRAPAAVPGPVLPSPPVVDLWWFDTRAEIVRPGDAAVMDPGERQRARTLLSALDRHRFEVAHVALRRVLAGYLGAAPGELAFGRQRCPRCGRGPGRPVLRPGHGAAPWFSLAHSGDLVLIAVAGRPVGADLERDRDGCVCPVTGVLHPDDAAALAPLAEPDRHRAVIGCWVRAEAVLKCTGEGIAHGLGGLRVRPASADPGRSHRVRGCSVRGVAAPPGYQAALALAGPGQVTPRPMAAWPGPG